MNNIIKITTLLILTACNIVDDQTAKTMALPETEVEAIAQPENEPETQEPIVESNPFDHLAENEVCLSDGYYTQFDLDLSKLPNFVLNYGTQHYTALPPYIKNTYHMMDVWYERNVKDVPGYKEELVDAIIKYFELQGLVYDTDFEIDPNFPSKLAITLLDRDLRFGAKCSGIFDPTE